MSEKSNTTSTETVDVAQKEKTKYTVKKLRENSVQLFNCTTSTFDGAMYNVQATEMTVDEAKTIINKWLGKGK